MKFFILLYLIMFLAGSCFNSKRTISKTVGPTTTPVIRSSTSPMIGTVTNSTNSTANTPILNLTTNPIIVAPSSSTFSSTPNPIIGPAPSSILNPTPNFIFLSSRAYNLCLSRESSNNPIAHKCSAQDSSSIWQLSETEKKGIYTLRNMNSNTCLASSGTSLFLAECSLLKSINWSFNLISGDNNNHALVKNDLGLCLSNSSLNGESGSLELASCNPEYWSQQWKKNGVQNEISGAKDAPWFGHDRFCTDTGVLGTPSTCETNGKWWLFSACEDAAFLPVRGIKPGTGMGCILENQTCQLGTACLWQRGFTPIAGTQGHQLTMALDKINFPDEGINETYTNTFLVDVLGPANGMKKAVLSEEYVLEVRMRLHALELNPSPPGHARVLIGFAAVDLDSKKSMFLEVVLNRDSWYDLCTPTLNKGGLGVSSPCDPNNIYDRRSAWGTGEQVWFTASTLNYVPGVLASSQPVLFADKQWYAYQIPFSRLFRNYKWTTSVAPANWSRVQLEHIYMGIEEFGRARVWLDMDGYRVYQTSNWQP